MCRYEFVMFLHCHIEFYIRIDTTSADPEDPIFIQLSSTDHRLGRNLWVATLKRLSAASGVARGVLRGLEHPLSQKRKTNRIGIFQKIKIIGNTYTCQLYSTQK